MLPLNVDVSISIAIPRLEHNISTFQIRFYQTYTFSRFDTRSPKLSGQKD